MLLANLNAGLAGTSPRLLSKYSAAADLFLRVSDMAIVLGAALIAYRLLHGVWMPGADYRIVIGTSLLFAVICFNAMPLYRSWRGLGLRRELAVLAGAWIATFALFSIYALALGLGQDVSRLWVGTWFAGGFALLAGSRTLVRGTMRWLRSLGVDVQRIVVVGLRPPVVRIHRYLRQNPWLGMQLLGYFRTADDMVVSEGSELNCLGDVYGLPGFIAFEGVEEVWVSMPLGKLDGIKPLLAQLERTPIKVKLIPDLVDISLLNQAGEQLGNVPVISLRQSSVGRETQFLVTKAIVDRLLALLALLALAPVMIAIAVAVKLDSPGPVLFRQRRQGRAGREFQMLKFRSMRVHREGEHQVTQATRADPRVTKVGTFLRRTSLDELPQLFNVLGGSMSLVGPRPHAMPHNRHYQSLINCYAQRHYVKPGITGWAQVNGFRGETPRLRDMRKRVQYDLDYIRRWSLWFDIRILALTVVRVLGQKTAY